MMAPTPQRITRDDIEHKFRDLRGDVDAGVEQARGYALVAGSVAIALLVLGAYLSGRRRGRRRATFVEIRRL